MQIMNLQGLQWLYRLNIFIYLLFALWASPSCGSASRALSPGNGETNLMHTRPNNVVLDVAFLFTP